MNTERKPVDVLAVMAELIALPHVECDEDQRFVDAATEARDAVAELIAAAEALAPRYCNMTTVAGRNEMSRRLETMRAALARVGVQS